MNETLKIDNPDMFTAEDLCKMLEQQLPEVLPNLAFSGKAPAEVLPMLDYILTGYEYRNRLIVDLLDGNDYYWAEATPSTGGSEGVYLDIRLVTQSDGAPKRWPIITAKTLEEGPAAYAAMGLLGGSVTYLIERIINTNY